MSYDDNIEDLYRVIGEEAVKADVRHRQVMSRLDRIERSIGGLEGRMDRFDLHFDRLERMLRRLLPGTNGDDE